MTAKEIYEKQTGDIAPDNQIGFYEWDKRYTSWMERKIEKLYKTI